MLPTPSTKHVNYDQIYEPAEDSFLFLDALSSQAERDFLRIRFAHEEIPSPLVLEVGTGSGVILAFVHANAAHILGRPDVATIGTDVNSFACKAAARTVEKAASDAQAGIPTATFLACLRVDLTIAFRAHSVDVLLFNPPYVPTDVLPDIRDELDLLAATPDVLFQRDSRLLSYSYAGGVDGMEITSRLLTQLPDVLSDRGMAYILLCAKNKPHEVQDWVRKLPGRWAAEIVASSGKTAGMERLCILRIWRT